ncbi:MAG: HNH endonuclease [Tannerella sp.]|jgi:5-methylcytosine-specific restriction protein A|nr:HNH endonuclease [Tannerella sp.]
MPQINKPKKKRISAGDSREIRQKIYGTVRWRSLRRAHLMEHPLCERCLSFGTVTPAEDVHHVVPFMKAGDTLSRRQLAYDPENLQSLCRKCHTELH